MGTCRRCQPFIYACAFLFGVKWVKRALKRTWHWERQPTWDIALELSFHSQNLLEVTKFHSGVNHYGTTVITEVLRQVALIVLTREVGKIPTTQRKILRHKQSPTAISHLYLVTTYLITKHNVPPLNTTNLSRPLNQMILKHLHLNDALILNLSCAKKFIEETFSWRYPSNDSSLRPNQVEAFSVGYFIKLCLPLPQRF